LTKFVKFLILFFGLFVALSTYAEKKISIRSHSLVSPGTLTMGDIAEFHGLSSVELSYFKRIPLGDAPSYGEERRFSNQGLSEMFRVYMKKIRSEEGKFISLNIPSEVVVNGSGLIITKSQIRNRLIKASKDSCNKCEIQIKDLRLPKISIFPPGSRWRLSNKEKIKGPFTAALEVTEPSGNVRIFWISGKLLKFRGVPVATRVLNPGVRIQDGDFKFMRRDVTFARDSIPDKKGRIGCRVRIGLSTNHIIWRSHLARRRAVIRGQTVSVTTTDKRWSIRIQGIAQQNGLLGDFIKVLNKESKRIIVGKVISDGVVQVQ